MRKRRTEAGLTVNAIAGTHVVLLGLDFDAAHRKGCLGFAIQREDHTEDERSWLTGMKTFKATDPGLGPGGQVSSREHPFQTFRGPALGASRGPPKPTRAFPPPGGRRAAGHGRAAAVASPTAREA